MDFRSDPASTSFADEVRTWLEEHLVGEFARYRGRGLTRQEDAPVEVQLARERELASGGWLGLDFPEWIGGQGEAARYNATSWENGSCACRGSRGSRRQSR